MKYIWYSKSAIDKSPDYIHQALAYGSLKDVLTIRKNLGLKLLKELFLNSPKNVYNDVSFNFIKKFVLKINKSVDESKYLKSSPRRIG